MIMNAIRTLMFFLDTVVFWVVRLLFELFMLISNAEIFSSDVIKGFYGRIYALVGIFMLFKVSFSVITMIANPDTLNDKNQGLGKITTKVMITIVLLLIMPNIFNLMYDLQREIVKSNILGTIILGIGEGENIDSVSIGKQLSYTSFSAFFYCREDLRTVNSDGSAKCNITNSDARSAWNNANNNYDVSLLGDALNAKDNDKYIFEYKSPMSLVGGIFIAYILISFCFDIAVRSVKLGFLQIMAPIPIILNVDPKSSKDGAFNNWVKTLVMTYLDLFMRLIIIFFVVFVLGAINNITFNDPNADWVLQQFAKIFIIIGALMFAKQAPGLIKDLFGIKGDANSFGDLNPFKKMASSPFVSAAVGGIAGIGAGAIGNFAASRQAGRNVFQSLGSGAAGMFSGGARGFGAGFKDTNHNGFMAGLGAGGLGGQHILNNQGTSFLGRTAARAQSAIGMQTQAQRMKSRLDAYSQYAKGRENIKSIAEGDKTARTWSDPILSAYTHSDGSNYNVNDFKEEYERAVNSGMSEQEIVNRKALWDMATNEAINQDMGNVDTSIGAIKASMDRLAAENPDAFEGKGIGPVTNASELGKAYGKVKNESTVLEQSEEYQRAQRTQEAIKGNNNKK